MLKLSFDLLTATQRTRGVVPIPTFSVEYYPILPQHLRATVYRILDACESEFVPPLSMRASTHQDDLLGGHATPNSGVQSYFNEMVNQQFLLAFSEKDGSLLAFLSFIPDYHLPHNALNHASAYVSTICTKHEARGQGIARALYTELERVDGIKTITLRTWSTNESQLHALESLDYRILLRIPNDRGYGIDTIYFAKELQKHGFEQP